MERKITDGAERKELHRIVLFVLAFVVTIVCIGTGSIPVSYTHLTLPTIA